MRKSVFTAAVVAVLTTSAGLLAAPTELPDTIAARRFQAFLDAYAAGTDEAIRTFERQHRAPGPITVETRVESAKEYRKTWGTLTPKLVLFDREETLSVLSQSTGKVKWYRCEVILEKADPHRLVGVVVAPAVGPDLCIQSYNAENLADAIDRLRAAAGVPALAIGTIRGDAIDTAVAGVRRIDAADAADENDCFHLGSVTKSVTATVIGHLVEQGILDWESTLGELLPDIEMLPVYREITLEQLLQHRSGLARSPDSVQFKTAVQGSATDMRAALAAQVLASQPVAEPGKQFQYSNFGYSVAGHIAERAANRSWKELTETEVFKPLGMATAGFGWPATDSRRSQPYGHYKKEGGWRSQELGEDPLPPAAGPAGDVHCSIGDLARYASFHLKGLRGADGILKAQTVQRLHTPPPRNELSKNLYAGGWYIEDLRSIRRHSHGGSGGSFLAIVVLEPESNIAVVVAANALVLELHAMADFILDWLRSANA